MKRRALLKTAGVSLCLPPLESFGAKIATTKPNKMLFISLHLGLVAEHLFPKKAGPLIEETTYLKAFGETKNELSIYRGLEHKNLVKGHFSSPSLLTGYYNPNSPKNIISVDQIAADKLGGETRFPSLALRCSKEKQLQALSWDRYGTPVPQHHDTLKIFNLLFGVTQSSDNQENRIEENKSILDHLTSQIKKLKGQVSQYDSENIDDYLNSIRELEKQLAKQKYWAKKSKPKVNDFIFPEKETLMTKLDSLFSLMHLALQTDSTRFMTLSIDYKGAIGLSGVRGNYHALSHHGYKQDKLNDLIKVEFEILKKYSAFINKLKETKAYASNLLGESLLFMGSPLGSGSSHKNQDLPVLLAGGNLEHNKFTVYKKSRPLNDLYLSMLNQMGLQKEKLFDSVSLLDLS